MRMLFLTTRLPFPPVGGEKLRPFYFLKYLSLRWKITLLSFIEAEGENAYPGDYAIDNVTIRTVRLPRFESYLKCARRVFSSQPLEVAYYSSGRMERLVREELYSGGYDLVFCHLVRMAEYLRGYRGPKKALDISDALSLRYSLSYKLRRDPLKLVEWLEYKRLREYEPRIFAQFDLNLISSSVDKRYLEQELGIKDLTLIENGVDKDMLGNRNKATDQEKIVFFANLRAFHNVDAVLYFYKSIFPMIKRRVKGAKLAIIGANIPPGIIRMGCDNSVSIYRDVDDIYPYICDACVSVAPMRIAVGIQNKIIQSMASGIPVVTTTVGLGGIGAAINKEVLVGDTPQDFAYQVTRLMEDRGLRDRITENASRLIREKYLWPNVVENLNEKLTTLIRN